MDDDVHGVSGFFCEVINWTVMICAIGSTTSQELFIQLDTSRLFDLRREQLGILQVVLVHSSGESPRIIVSDSLFGSSCHSIMMLENTHDILHAPMSVEDVLFLLVGHRAIESMQRI
jgi:hypothetical protein